MDHAHTNAWAEIAEQAQEATRERHEAAHRQRPEQAAGSGQRALGGGHRAAGTGRGQHERLTQRLDRRPARKGVRSRWPR